MNRLVVHLVLDFIVFVLMMFLIIEAHSSIERLKTKVNEHIEEACP